MEDNLFGGLGVEVKLSNPDNFLKVVETLTRIGVAAKNENKLYQTCHLLHKQGRYVILHFKEMFKIEGKPSTYNEEDEARRNRVVDLLFQWNLIELDDDVEFENIAPMSKLKVVSFKDKENWILCPKYTMKSLRK